MNQITTNKIPNFSVQTPTIPTNSSLLFLSTGQVKKQKKFRETAEYYEQPKIINREEQNVVKKQISPIKQEPKIDRMLKNNIEEIHHEEIVNISRLNCKLTLRKLPKLILILKIIFNSALRCKNEFNV